MGDRIQGIGAGGKHGEIEWKQGVGSLGVKGTQWHASIKPFIFSVLGISPFWGFLQPPSSFILLTSSFSPPHAHHPPLVPYLLREMGGLLDRAAPVCRRAESGHQEIPRFPIDTTRSLHRLDHRQKTEVGIRRHRASLRRGGMAAPRSENHRSAPRRGPTPHLP